MGNNVVVWDLETVPDLAGYAAANGLVGRSDAEIREAMGDGFPKLMYHSIVCIGALVAHRDAQFATLHRSLIVIRTSRNCA
jgi:predicted PolB exonuclease-like 3'-5' exonuclease